MGLTAIPEIGPVTAKAIADWLPPEYQSMAHALRSLTDIEFLSLPNRPRGVGVKTIQAVRNWFGIKYDEEIRIMKRLDPL
jgi:hypothetical protein